MAAEVRLLRHDPAARRSYDGFRCGFVWSDEWNRAIDGATCGRADHGWHAAAFRSAVEYRASVIRGNPDPQHRAVWDAFRHSFPDWPGFRSERSDPSLAADLEADARAFFENHERGDF